MSVSLRQPDFHGTDKEKVEQIASYLFQLNETLQWAFDNISAGAGGQQTTVILPKSMPASTMLQDGEISED
jgi:hypothetical protein